MIEPTLCSTKSISALRGSPGIPHLTRIGLTRVVQQHEWDVAEGLRLPVLERAARGAVVFAETRRRLRATVEPAGAGAVEHAARDDEVLAATPLVEARDEAFLFARRVRAAELRPAVAEPVAGEA